MQNLIPNASSVEEFTIFLINFFNQTPQDYKLESAHKNMNKDRALKFLLMLENVEDIVSHDEENLRSF